MIVDAHDALVLRFRTRILLLVKTDESVKTDLQNFPLLRFRVLEDLFQLVVDVRYRVFLALILPVLVFFAVRLVDRFPGNVSADAVVADEKVFEFSLRVDLLELLGSGRHRKLDPPASDVRRLAPDHLSHQVDILVDRIHLQRIQS